MQDYERRFSFVNIILLPVTCWKTAFTEHNFFFLLIYISCYLSCVWRYFKLNQTITQTANKCLPSSHIWFLIHKISYLSVSLVITPPVRFANIFNLTKPNTDHMSLFSTFIYACLVMRLSTNHTEFFLCLFSLEFVAHQVFIEDRENTTSFILSWLSVAKWWKRRRKQRPSFLPSGEKVEEENRGLVLSIQQASYSLSWLCCVTSCLGRSPWTSRPLDVLRSGVLGVTSSPFLVGVEEMCWR